MDVHKLLIDNVEIYPPAFVEVAMKGPFWNTETSKQREEAMRHTMVCMLLCNTKVMPGKSEGEVIVEEILGGTAQYEDLKVDPHFDRAREELFREAESTSSEKRAYVEFIPEGNPLDMSFRDEAGPSKRFRRDPEWTEDEESSSSSGSTSSVGDIYSDEEEDREMDITDYDPSEMIKGGESRYLCLEGRGEGGSLTQSEFSRAWGKTVIGNFDIIDQLEKKFIEVKVTRKKLEESLNDAKAQHEDGANEHGYIIVELDDYRFNYFNMSPMPGEDMAGNFLRRRQEFIDNCGITVGRAVNFDPADVLIMDRLVDTDAEIWSRKVRAHAREPIQEVESSSFTPIPWDAEKFLSILEDPREREGDYARWKGKILACSMTKSIVSKHEKDRDMTAEYIHIMGPLEEYRVVGWEEEKGLKLFEALKKTLPLIANSESSHAVVKVIRRNKGYVPTQTRHANEWSSLLPLLGVGQKKYRMGKTFNSNMKMEKSKPRELLKYVPWIEGVMEMERASLGNDVRVLDDIDYEEASSNHTLDEVAKNVCKDIHSLFRTRVAGATCSRAMGFYSRLGGSYVQDDKEKNKVHASVACFPIYYAEYSPEGEKVRRVSGICIRGPHHAKESTDKINFITIEEYNPEHEHALGKGIIVNKIFWVKQNSIPKEATVYLTFLHNLLFLPSNFVGDMLLKSATSKGDLLRNSTNVILDNRHFLLHYMIENLLMGMLGGSQEEGHMACYRMVFMLMHQRASGNAALVMDMEGLAKELNECVIDSPLVMYHQVCLIKSLKLGLDRGTLKL